jgi:glycosyltransferase involved in cell wall biosynthesis
LSTDNELVRTDLKPAIFHDWLNGMRGGEKCLEAMLEVFPRAEVFTLIHEPEKVSDAINSKKIHVHPISKFPLFKKKYRTFIPLLPLIVGRWPKLKGFDFVISSSHCVAKGFNSNGLKHICYCYSPMRYIWDMFDDYFLIENVPWWKKALMKALRPHLQKWDINSSKKIDHFIAISKFISERIENCYQLPSSVTYPFADLDFYHPENVEREDYYLVVSALVPYKNISIVVEAFNESQKRLIIIGTGPEEKYLKSIAKNNIEFKGWVDNDVIKEHYCKAKAFIFPGVEDFGITPVEAMACGCPVIALKKGGTCETIVDIEENPETGTGLFFEEAITSSLNNCIVKYENTYKNISQENLQIQAKNFSIIEFKNQIYNTTDHISKI